MSPVVTHGHGIEGTREVCPTFLYECQSVIPAKQTVDEVPCIVIPAKAGIQESLRDMDSGFRRNDESGKKRPFPTVSNAGIQSIIVALAALLFAVPACKQTDGDFRPPGTDVGGGANELDLESEAPSILANGVDNTMLTATVYNAEGDPLSQVTVRFSTPYGTVDRFAVTDSLGRALVILTSEASAQDLDANVLAEVFSERPDASPFLSTRGERSLDTTAAAEFQVRDRTTVVMRGITLTVSAEPDAIPADGLSTAAIAATVAETTRGVPLVGVDVSFGVSEGTITGRALTDTTGRALATLTSAVEPAVVEVRAFLGSTLSAATDVTFSAAPPPLE